jgi:alpha-tubulin suppressor-like RCC1 family protein
VDTSTISGNKAFVQVSALGPTHTCGITADGVAYCWGFDNYGQLGNGPGMNDTQGSPFPVDTSTISGNKAFVQLNAAGTWHNCGITATGAAYCWGRDEFGELGNGSAVQNTQSPSPVDVSTMGGNKAFRHMAIGGLGPHNCGLAADGVSHCWGLDQYGQLGNGGSALDTQSPSLVDTSAISGNKMFVQLATGYHHTCGLTADGVAYCWGRDLFGALGNGGGLINTQGPSLVDMGPITGNKAFVRLYGGVYYTCGLTADGVAYCWGLDEEGELGNGGISEDTASPSMVDTTGI